MGGTGVGASGSEGWGVAVAACSGADVAEAAGTAVGGTDVAAGADVGVADAPQAAATMTTTKNMLKTLSAILCFLAPRKVRFDPLINFITS